MRIFRVAIALSLTVSAALFVVWSWHWPLVGDASLLHLLGFVIEHGRVPYREIPDMNMPGSYLVDMALMKTFGGGALAWRLFDFSLLAVIAGSYFVITRRWFPSVFAGTMLALVHGRDGMAQAGQRDLIMAGLLVVSTAFLSAAVRRRAWWLLFAFGVLAGIALTIKPTTLPLSLSQLFVAAWVMRVPRPPTSQKRDPSAGSGQAMGHPVLHPVWTFFWGGLGMVCGPLVALIFLWREHAARAFWVTLRTLVPFYASLGHRPLAYLLLHSVSPLLALVWIWFAVLGLARPRLDWQRGLLLCGVVFGLLSFVVQARGWPYHRYPLLAFLLPLMALDLEAALAGLASRALRLRLAAGLSMVALVVGGFWLGPQSAVLIHRVRWWQTEFLSTLEANLDRLGGPKLSGNVQCIDWFSGCGTTLYKMRLLPASGVLSDFLLFGPPQEPAVVQTRQVFGEVFAHPPQVIVVSSYLQFAGPGEYRKLALWPEFQQFLAQRYRLETDWKPTRTERWWSREELPEGYRIYVLR